MPLPKRKIRTLVLLFCVVTFTMLLFSYTFRDPSLYFFKYAFRLSDNSFSKGACACRQCMTELEDEPWFTERFNLSIQPLMTRGNSMLSDETFKWWQWLQAERHPANYTEVVEELFQVIPDEMLFMNGSPERCRTCAVVGNSGNLKGSQYGDLIDSSDLIIRMPVENQEGRSVEVLGLPDGVDEELLSLYFENKRRSGGGPLASVEKEGDRALLVFEEAEVAACVLSKGHHALHNTELTVRRPPLKDPWRLLLRGVNANTNLELVELYVENLLGMEMDGYSLEALLERGLVLVHFTQPLSQDFQQLSAKISKKPLDGSKITLEQIEQTDTISVENLPPGISTVTLASYLESTGAGNHKVKEVNVTSPSTARVSFVEFDSVVDILNRPHKLENAELNMRPYFAHLQPTESLSSLNSGNQPLDISMDSARHNLSSPAPVGAGSQSSQQIALAEVAHTAAEVAEEVMEDLTKDREPLTSHVAIPDPLKLALFRISPLPQDIVQAYPNFDIKVRDDGVYIAGPDELTMGQLKNAILEFLGSIAQTQFPVDTQMAQLLTDKAVRRLLLEKMKERGLPSIYSVVANVVAVTSLSINHVNQACSLLKSQFCSFSIPVDKEYECMLYSEELSGFLQSLSFCSARVSESTGVIEVMTLKEMESDMQEKIVTFLSTPIERETVITMEPGRLKYIQLHHHQLMADMDQVSIVPLEAEDVCGLKIHGNAMACQMATEVLQSVVSSICTRTITSMAPGVSRFLLEDEGPIILQEITTKFQVYISMDRVYWKRTPNEDIFDAAWKMMSQQSFQKVSLDGSQDMEVLTQTGLIEEAKRIVSVIDEKMDVAPSTSDKTDDMEDEDLYTAGEPTVHDDDELIINAPSDFTEMEGATAGNPGLQDEARGRPPANLEEEAQMSLAIQYSMDYTTPSSQAEEEEELQKVLELSMKTAKHQGPAVPAKESPKQVKDVYASMQEEIKAINTSQISVFASYTSDLIRTDIALAKKITLRQVEEKLEQKGLKNMSEFHKRCLDVVKRKHAVEIKTQGNMVIISGFKDFVSSALPDLKLVLKKMSSATSDAEILKTLQWVRHDAEAATPYAPDTTVFIETAWKMKQKKINLLLNNQPHIINFEKMEEYNVVSGKTVKMARKMLSLVDLTNESEEDYSLLSSMPEVARVDEDSDEFQNVVKEFYESIQKYHSKIRIIKVEKLMNRLLYKQYQLKKASITQSATEPEIERTLYHGTSESSVKEICIHGFNRSFCGKNATVYGQGVYFAVNSALSVQEQYSPPNAEGYKFIFVGKVLTGDYTRGDHSMKTAPLKESDDIPLRYDSVTDNITTPTMFVIFNDTQAYPEYLITCQKIHR